jgi:hypothetical protein
MAYEMELNNNLNGPSITEENRVVLLLIVPKCDVPLLIFNTLSGFAIS